jgi:hypothetical protein
MDNESKIPDSWAMPDDLAKKVSDKLNIKSLSPEDEIANALEELARDIALIETDPVDWGGWVNYLLERMEEEANRRRKLDKFDKMLRSLMHVLGNKTSSG